MSFFDSLPPTKKQEKTETFEDVEGRFTCQERDCWEHTNEAKYNEAARLLTWKCPDGHVSVIEDFDL